MFLEISQNSQENNFIKKETLTHVFSCEFCENSKNTFYTEHFHMTASDYDDFKGSKSFFLKS